jgi:hypothetical protein
LSFGAQFNVIHWMVVVTNNEEYFHTSTSPVLPSVYSDSNLVPSPVTYNPVPATWIVYFRLILCPLPRSPFPLPNVVNQLTLTEHNYSPSTRNDIHN